MVNKKIFLNSIIEKKKEEIKELYSDNDFQKGFELNEKNSFNKFYKAITKQGLNLIAEVKKASPSKGIIRKDFDPVSIAKEFKQKNAAAVSVLTEKHYFLGSPDYLNKIKKEVDLPVLRKDFIIDPIQVYETKKMGADALLLIKAILTSKQTQELINLSNSLDLDVLLEVHNLEELDEISELKGNFIVGINNRNLHTFDVDIKTAIKIINKAKTIFSKETAFVAESGYTSQEQIKNLSKHGFNAVLIGEGLAKYPELITLF